MRISDWSSDVCSSDLHPFHRRSHEIDVLGKVSSTAQHMGEQHIECARHDLYQSDAGQRHGLSAGQSRKDTRYADRPTRVDFTQHVQQRSEEHTSELQSLMRISYAVFCLKKKINNNN